MKLTFKDVPRKHSFAWPAHAKKRIRDLTSQERKRRRVWHMTMAIASAVQGKDSHAKYHADSVADIDDHVREQIEKKKIERQRKLQAMKRKKK